MNVKIDDYHIGSRIVSLACTDRAAKMLQIDGVEYMSLATDSLVFYPEHYVLKLSETAIQSLNQCSDYDVFQINSEGSAYRCYNNNSLDNAIMLTAHCNSNCLMCPSSDLFRRQVSSPTIEEYLEIIRHIPSDAEHLTITGGEPFLVGTRIFEVFSALKKKFNNTSFLLLTNGRALSYAPFIERFEQTIPYNTITAIPLHGYDSKTHDAITRSPGGFGETCRGIKNLLQINQNVEIRIVVSKLNYNIITHISEYVISYFRSVRRVVIMGLEMLGNAAKYEKQVWISYREAFLSSKDAIKKLIESGINVELYNFPLCAVDREYYHICAKSISDYKIRFAEECEQCLVKDACGGIFAGTIRLARSGIKPVTKHD